MCLGRPDRVLEHAEIRLRSKPGTYVFHQGPFVLNFMPSSSVDPCLDTKGDIRVHSFAGSDADWGSFKLKFEAHADLLGMVDYMDAAKNEINKIDNVSLSQDAINRSKALCALLIARCEGQALAIVTLAWRWHGFEAWRLLKRRYEGKQGSKIAATLAAS